MHGMVRLGGEDMYQIMLHRYVSIAIFSLLQQFLPTLWNGFMYIGRQGKN